MSPNQEPEIFGARNNRVTFPENYDHKAQQQVAAARKELYENCDKALPALVEVLDDKRYCMTIRPVDGDNFYNHSVGQIVRQVIAANLEVYRSHLRFSKPRWNKYTFPVSKEWGQLHKSLPLEKLQVEAIDWAIGMVKTEIKEAGETQQAELTKELIALEKLRNEISQSGKPVKRGNMFPMVTKDR